MLNKQGLFYVSHRCSFYFIEWVGYEKLWSIKNVGKRQKSHASALIMSLHPLEECQSKIHFG